MLLRVGNLSKNFGGLIAVDEVSFDVSEGKIQAIIGPNGAGKTTILNLICGLDRPSKGLIEFKGINITHMPAYKIATFGLARTFQNIQLFGQMSVLENVMTGLYLKSKTGFVRAGLWFPSVDREEETFKERAYELLHFMDLSSRADSIASTLPYGEQRLLEIARALAVNPTLLLLDEPAAGLNAQETALLGEKIKKMKELGITILIVEHDMKLVMKISDEIIVLNYGRKIAQGTPSSIRNDPRVISAYLGMRKGMSVYQPTQEVMIS
ncbi:MAG: ABC transporter ATP-binding protein [Candidatus Methanomethylicaceae archaeon]